MNDGKGAILSWFIWARNRAGFLNATDFYMIAMEYQTVNDMSVELVAASHSVQGEGNFEPNFLSDERWFDNSSRNSATSADSQLIISQSHTQLGDGD